MSDRKKIIYAIVGSLILHVIIILGSSKVITLWPDVPPPEQKVDETPPQMTMLDSPPPEEQQKQERQYLRTNDDQKTDQKPPDSMFESDKDTAAASEQPAKGEAPLPTQDGKDTKDDLGFKNEQYSLADQGQAFSTDPGRQAPSQPEQKEEKQEEAKPVETPTPTPPPTPTPTGAPPPPPPPTVPYPGDCSFRRTVGDARTDADAAPDPYPEATDASSAPKRADDRVSARAADHAHAGQYQQSRPIFDRRIGHAAGKI
jgi:hypothetical protein